MLVTSNGKATTTKELIEGSIGVLIEALEAGRSEVLTAYLSAMSKFHYYSFRNVLLIAVQKLGATRVAGIYAWNELGAQSEAGRERHHDPRSNGGKKRNKRHEQSESDVEQADAKSTNGTRSNGQLVGFRPVYVWDVLQTEGKISRCCWDSVGANQRKLMSTRRLSFRKRQARDIVEGSRKIAAADRWVIIYRRTGGQPR